MTPVPLQLPLRPADAVSVANLIFDLAEGKPLTGELRDRLSRRSSVLRLPSLTPYFGSLERDPVHPSTYYLAVDGENREPLLLHMAPANAPTSSLFSKPLLIGRMPRARGPEMVINCLPFGPSNPEAVARFAAGTDARLLPRPSGPKPSIVVESREPETDFPIALEAFRWIAKRGGKNLAAFEAGAELNACAVWTAIRAGWREGYSLGTTMVLEDPENAREPVREPVACSRFTVAIGHALRTGVEFPRAVQAAAASAGSIRQARAALKTGRSFDFELDLRESPQPTSVEDLQFCLSWMKSRGVAVQSVAPEPGGIESLTELAAVALPFGCTLTVGSRAAHDRESLAAIGRATLGRVNYRLRTAELPASANDLADAIQQAAAHLYG